MMLQHSLRQRREVANACTSGASLNARVKHVRQLLPRQDMLVEEMSSLHGLQIGTRQFLTNVSWFSFTPLRASSDSS